MIPAGVAAIQSRMAVLENRFAPTDRPTATSTVDFERMLGAARAEFPTTTTPEATSTATKAANRVHGVDPSHGIDGVHKTHGPGPAGAPADLAAYGNGHIPAGALEPVGQGNHRLWAPAARNFRAMSDAAAHDGVHIPISDSYRSYEAQVDVAERKGLYGQGGLAAVPGTSNHGWGRALDIDVDNGVADWLRTHAADYGFHEDVPGEPWHWTYRP